MRRDLERALGLRHAGVTLSGQYEVRREQGTRVHVLGLPAHGFDQALERDLVLAPGLGLEPHQVVALPQPRLVPVLLDGANQPLEYGARGSG